jgi:hypothetical protein
LGCNSLVHWPSMWKPQVWSLAPQTNKHKEGLPQKQSIKALRGLVWQHRVHIHRASPFPMSPQDQPLRVADATTMQNTLSISHPHWSSSLPWRKTSRQKQRMDPPSHQHALPTVLICCLISYLPTSTPQLDLAHCSVISLSSLPSVQNKTRHPIGMALHLWHLQNLLWLDNRPVKG